MARKHQAEEVHGRATHSSKENLSCYLEELSWLSLAKWRLRRKMTPSKYHGDKNQCLSQQTKLQEETCHKLSKHQKGETVEQPSSKIHIISLNQLLFTPVLLPGPQFQYPKLRAEVHHSRTSSWNNKLYQIVHKHENAPAPFPSNSTMHSTASRQRECYRFWFYPKTESCIWFHIDRQNFSAYLLVQEFPGILLNMSLVKISCKTH